MQHLDGRLEHLHEFKQALGGTIEAARIRVGVGVVLAEILELADIDLTDERRDVLIVLVPGLRLRDADLPQARGIELHDLELRDIAAELVEALDRPRRHPTRQLALRDAVLLLEHWPHRRRIEQAERALIDRADLVAGLEQVDRTFLHQLLEPLGEGRFPAADRAEQVKDLLALLEPLRGVPEEAHDALDGLFEAEEIRERWVDLDRPVEEDAPEPGVLRGVNELRLADGCHHALCRARVQHRVGAAAIEILLQSQLGMLMPIIALRVDAEDLVCGGHALSRCSRSHCSPGEPASPLTSLARGLWGQIGKSPSYPDLDVPTWLTPRLHSTTNAPF